MKKKGQAEIIVIVLIILLVLASIIIIWAVVNGIVKESSEQVDIDPILLKGDVKYKDIDKDNVQVDIERGAGGGEISGIKIFFIYDSTTYTYQDEDYPEELETKTYYINSEELIPEVPEDFDFNNIEEISFRFIFVRNNKNVTTQEIDSSDEPDENIFCFDGDIRTCKSPPLASLGGASCFFGDITCINGVWVDCVVDISRPTGLC